MAAAMSAAAWHANRNKAVSVSQADIGKVFARFDTDGSGELDKGEVRKAIIALLTPKVDKAVVVSDAVLDEVMKGKTVVQQEDFAALIVEVCSNPKRVDGSILGPGRKLPYQEAVHAFYRHPVIVQLIAFAIIGNFVINIVEKEIDPDPEDLQFEGFWSGADVTFNIVFIIELWANMWGYGGPVREWWNSGWNVFDTIIVLVGVLTMTPLLGPPLDKLKLMRAFRVFRLFRRIKPLNQIIMALIKSIPAVFYAFVVMFIFFCIYAILAVELFRDFGAGGYYYTYDEFGNRTDVDSITARGYVHGLEYYGTFMRALYTLFQVQTGESWSEAVARPLIFGLYRGSAITTGLFFVSFVILMQVVLVNVVVAVLLDSFASSPQDDVDVDGQSLVPAAEAASGAAASSATTPPVAASPATEGAKLEAKLDEIIGKLSKIDTLANVVAELRGDVTIMKTELAKARGVSSAVQQHEA